MKPFGSVGMLDGFGTLVTASNYMLFFFLKPMLQHKVLSQQQIGSLAVSTHIKPIHTYTGWWFGTFFIFSYIGNVIIPTDFDIFSEG